MVSEYLKQGRLYFRLVTKIKPGNYLLRINGRYIKDTYQRTIIQGDNTYYEFLHHKVNAYCGYDYVYELIPLKKLAQQAMEGRALPKILQQITGDPFIQPPLTVSYNPEWMEWTKEVPTLHNIIISSP